MKGFLQRLLLLPLLINGDKSEPRDERDADSQYPHDGHHPIPGQPHQVHHPLPGQPHQVHHPLSGQPHQVHHPLPGQPHQVHHSPSNHPQQVHHPLPAQPHQVHHPIPEQPHAIHHPLPTQPSGYPYHPSQPSYPDIIGPAYHPPSSHRAEPIYGHHPSHNCTVEDEILQAEICTPTYTSSCGPFKVKGTKLGEKEKCVSVSRTVCTQAKETLNVEVCIIEFQDRKQSVTATTVEVKFAKACEKQMVTVCQPQPTYGSPSAPYTYHTVQHCKEVGQETCYNVPTLESKQIQVEIILPEPVQKCETRSVIVPTVECEDVTDKRCVKLPSVEESDTEAQACVPVVANPKCDKVELVLPKQICRELLYGYAEKPVHQYEHPKSFLTHAGHVKYGPKVAKRFTPTENPSETIEAETPQVPESLPTESQE